MKKLFAILLIPFFLSPLSVISTEKTISLSNEAKYQLTASVVTNTTYFDIIPSNPNLYSDSNSYSDQALTVIAKTHTANVPLDIVALKINDQAIPIFQLEDGSYIEASRQIIYDDIIMSQQELPVAEFWLKDGFKFYDSPYIMGTKEVKTKLVAYTKVSVSEEAQTYHGTYYKVDGQGWISADDISETDNRMEKVQKTLTQKYNKPNYGIYIKQLGTNNSASLNGDVTMYSASVAKLATLYYVEEQLQSQTIKLEDKLKYTSDVNSFAKAYDPSGSGKISKTADNKDYTIENLLKAVAQNSDNVATNVLGYYIANQYDNDFQSTISSLIGTDFDMKERKLSAKSAADLMEAIYYQNGDIINYLSNTDFDNTRISKDISVQVAHKIGDAYDFKHDVAIVYADEPFIISVFTNNASYTDITNIANDVYAILK